MNVAISEQEMSELIKRTPINTPVKFVFGVGGITVSANDIRAQEMLQEIRDDAELKEHHEAFNHE